MQESAAIENGELRRSRQPSPSLDDTAVNGKAQVTTVGTRQLPLRTGYCYDPRMREHEMIIDEERPHPEDPKRITAIYFSLCSYGFIDDTTGLGGVNSSGFLRRIRFDPLTEADICLVHTAEHYVRMERTRHLDDEELAHETREGDSMYYNRASFDCALLSAGGVAACCKAVIDGTVRNAFAIVRPPGHHAEPDDAQGFCLMNNVAIATKMMLRDCPEQCRKVLILDWDVHHGNGTQTAFYDNPDVLVISIHIHKFGQFYPPTLEGAISKIGAGAGIGRNINIGWPDHGATDADYIYAFQKLVMPVATEFNPDIVIVSAGFDAAEGDPMGGCHVTPQGYGVMTHLLRTLADGKVVACLEGGYNLQAISDSAIAVVKVLQGDPPPRIQYPHPRPDAVETVKAAMAVHAPYWNTLGGTYGKLASLVDPEAVDIHIALRKRRVSDYQSKHGMISLVSYADVKRGSNPWEGDQACATSNFSTAPVLIVIVHDPPELIHRFVYGIPSEETQALVADRVKNIVAWAVDRGFGVIDVNAPRFQIMRPDLASNLEANRTNFEADTKSLCEFMWDNYIELTRAEHVITIGVGAAYIGLLRLLQARPDMQKVVSVMIAFVPKGIAIRPSAPSEDTTTWSWYHKHSQLYVAADHDIWQQAKPPKRRYGQLQPCKKASGLNPMIEESLEDMQDRILDSIPTHLAGTSVTEPAVHPQAVFNNRMAIRRESDSEMKVDID